MRSAFQNEGKSSPVADRGIIQAFMELVRSSIDVKGFWEEYIRLFSSFTRAANAVLIGEVEGKWKIADTYSYTKNSWPMTSELTNLALRAKQEMVATIGSEDETVLAIGLEVGPQESPPVLLLRIESHHPVPPLNTLLFAAALPSIFQVMRQYRKARIDVIYFAQLLQLVSQVADDEKFKLATLRICNETASLFHCDQVSLSWQRGNKMQVKSISNLESFENRAHAIWELEAAMEECQDQDAEILWPSEQSDLVTRAHESYAGVRRVGHLLTLPVRRKDRITGAITCERESNPFTEDEAWKLRLLLEQCSRWLEILEKRDQWIGRKIARKVGSTWNWIKKTERTGTKLVIVGGIAAFLLLFVQAWPYSVDGSFITKAQKTVHVSSPINGFIEQAPVRLGDAVKAGDLLIELDASELIMEKSAALARLSRHQREAEKAQALSSLAEMRISRLMAKETRADIDLLDYRLKSTRISSPFAGVVVEGDLQSKIGAPVRQGDVFMKVASLEDLMVEINIDEKHIYDFQSDAAVEIRFVGNPDAPFSARLNQLIPQAHVSNMANVFSVRAEIISPAEAWWRPGMSGIAKIEAGKRSAWWLLTHDLFDYLKLTFWL